MRERAGEMDRMGDTFVCVAALRSRVRLIFAGIGFLLKCFQNMGLGEPERALKKATRRDIIDD